MSNGLFFTGVVLKNNRDLLKEEATRQQLAMMKERLELQKQQLADKRAEARRKNLNVPTKNYDTKALLPELAKDFQSGCTSFQNEVDRNALLINDGDIDAKANFNEGQGRLNNQLALNTDISNSMQGYRDLVQEGKGDSLKTNEDGEYLFEVNYRNYVNAIQENPGADRFALEKQFTVREGMINETKWSDPNSALYKGEADKREGARQYQNEPGLTVSESFLTDEQFARPSTKIIQGLTPDSNGNWDDVNQKKVYLGQEGSFKVDGLDRMLSGPEAFAYETKGITSLEDTDGSSPFMDKLKPSSGDEHKALREEYVQYLAKKYEDQAREDYPTILKRDKKIKEEEFSLSDTDVDLLESKVDTKLFNGVNLKVGSAYEPSFKIQTGIPIPKSAFKEVPSQDTSKIDEDITTLQSDAQDRIKTTLTGVGMDEMNNPVAVVNFGPAETQALIPLSYIAGMSDVVGIIGKNKDVMRLINYANQKGTITQNTEKEILNW